MKRALVLISIATAIAFTSSAAFALSDTANCSSAQKANWAKCVIEESQKGTDG